jgi:hypothetical protein
VLLRHFVVLVIWVVVILCFIIIWVWLGLTLFDLGIGFSSILMF